MGKPHLSLGGVGRNLATGIELLGHKPIFITSLGNDSLGEFARTDLLKIFAPSFASNETEAQLSTRVKIIECQSSSCNSCFALVLIDSLTGLCEYVIADLDATKAVSVQTLQNNQLDLNLQTIISCAPLVVLDANVPSSTLKYLYEFCHLNRVPIFLEPTDVNCLPQLVESLEGLRANYQGEISDNKAGKAGITFMSPNIIELKVLLQLFGNYNQNNDDNTVEEAAAAAAASETLDEIKFMSKSLMENYLPELKCLLVTMDKRGLLVAMRCDSENNNDIGNLKLKELTNQQSCQDGKYGIIFKHFEPEILIESPVSGSGAGDCFASGFISGYLDELTLDECVQRGFKASVVALNSMDTVPNELAKLTCKSK